jgi:hypothetical protein
MPTITRRTNTIGIGTSAIAVLLVLVAGRVLAPFGRPTGAGDWPEAAAGLIVAGIGALYVILSVRGLRRPTPSLLPSARRIPLCQGVAILAA